MFEGTVPLTREDFNALPVLVCDALFAAMDVRGDHEGEARYPRRRRLNTQEMLFMFLDVIGGEIEGGVDIQRIGHRYGISIGTVSNCFRQVLFALFKLLSSVQPQLIG